MKSTRRFLTLLLCLLLVCTAAVASAATKKPSKTFTEVPTLKFTDTASSTPAGDMDTVVISASLPGFLNLYLIDESGSIALTIADNLEIHSKENTFDYYALNDNGDYLTPGTYTLSADMTSQFGVASKTITKDTEIEEAKEPIVAKKTAAPASSNTSSSKKTSSAVEENDSKPVEDTASEVIDEYEVIDVPEPTDAPKATPIPETASYTAGTYVMGDEGLLIGVGVEDSSASNTGSYWNLTADASDEEIWAAITHAFVGVDVAENETAYIYNSPESGRKKLGSVSGISQGLNVIKERDDGWALVEAFRNEDGAFIRGYIKSDKLRPAEPNPNYGIVIDKASQTLTVYKDGTRLGSCKVTTGLPTTKYPHRETPAGEFILVTRRGAYEYYGMGFTKYTVRVNGNYYLAEIPTTKKNGTKFIEEVEASLGSKGTRGTICVAHDASADGGINAKWLWDLTDENKRIKVLIFDDKARTDVPVSAK